MPGFIKLHRELIEKPIWLNSTPEQKSVLIAILLSVNFVENKWEWKGEKYKVLPGQMITSLDSIKNNCGKGISIQNIRTSLKRFEKLGFLTDESTKTGRLVIIINWDSYQIKNKDTNKANNKDLTDSQQRPNKDLTPNKKVKKEKKGKNVKNTTKKRIFSPPSKDQVIKYFIENEYDANKGSEAFEFYNCADWYDSRGNKVKNWKQKMRGVWFKDENKLINNKNNNHEIDTGDQWLQMRRDREDANK